MKLRHSENQQDYLQMKAKKIHFIINPASGQEEPILSYINTAFQETDIEWNVSITKKDNDAVIFAEQHVDTVDLIAVYGGDGSVAEVAQVLSGKKTPLAIIPGGTANVLSKELGIPQDTVKAIELLKDENGQIISMDMASANEELFLVRVNVGIMANMVLEAGRELKNKLGQLAYGVTAIETLIKADHVNYKMKIDDEIINENGVALTITNCGSIGIGEYSFLPDISVTDGMLDVILMNDVDLRSVLRVAGTTLMKKDSEVLKHWKCKEIEITFDTAQKFILDDSEREATSIRIKVLPKALNVLVPKNLTS